MAAGLDDDVAVKTQMIAHSPYLQASAITAEELAKITSEGIHTEQFMITTHPTTLMAFQKKAENYQGYIDFMVQRRAQAISMREALKKPSATS